MKVNLKLGHLALAIVIGFSGLSAQAKSASLGDVSSTSASFGNHFWGWGKFTDYYSFSLSGESTIIGSTSSRDSLWQDISLSSVLLQAWSGTGWTTWSGASSNPDASPDNFSFAGLGGGQYRLALSGYLAPQIDLRDPLRPASYQGTLRAIAAPVPEPAALALAVVGLLGVGTLAARRRRG